MGFGVVSLNILIQLNFLCPTVTAISLDFPYLVTRRWGQCSQANKHGRQRTGPNSDQKHFTEIMRSTREARGIHRIYDKRCEAGNYLAHRYSWLPQIAGGLN
jgi:hypothetical protein